MIPIIVINFNKLDALKKSLASYKKIPDSEVFVLDFGSDYEPLLKYYADMINVVYYEKIGSMDEMVKKINEFLDSLDEKFDYYVVTDSDIELNNPEESLKVYKQILRRVKDADVVAPMLKIDDLPNNKYANEQVKLQKEQFWRHPPKLVGKYFVTASFVDTTFGLYRKGRFDRLMFGLRVHSPYDARHLDWYDDPVNLT